MAKTVFPDNYSGLAFGYGVDTTVTSYVRLYDGNTPPNQIGTQVYVVSNTGIAVDMLLEIGGAGQVTVSDVGTDPGNPNANPPIPDRYWFTCSNLISPANGAYVRTPWNTLSGLLYTRADGNSVTLTYTAGQHDLYFRTQKTSDSGSIGVTLDGNSLGSFNLHSATTIRAEVLLQAAVAGGTHTVAITTSVGGAVFVYFNGFSAVEHVIETGGEYLDLGPAGTLEDSTNDCIGDWATSGPFAFNSDGAGSVFFYPQLDTGGKATARFQMRSDAAIIAVYVNGVFKQNIDLYANPGLNPIEVDILDTANGDAPGQYSIELRNTGTKNASSSGLLFYFHSSVVYFSRTDTQALVLIADYLKQVAAIRGDGAFLDAWDSNRINFDSNALYGCMGLLAAYDYGIRNPGSGLALSAYLDAVKNFLTWFASMQTSAPGDSFSDGAWYIGYQVNPSPPPTYIPAIAPYDLQGFDAIKWVDTIQILGCFVLWWYWKLSGDATTRDSLLPTYKKGVDGLLKNNYDGGTGFLYSSWQHVSGGNWQLLKSRFGADQSDDILGLTALWLMTRQAKYATITARLIRRFVTNFWSSANWCISIDGDAPDVANTALYPQTTGYTVFAQKQSRFSSQPAGRLLAGLRAMEAYATSEGGFLVPLYAEAERIFSAFYVLGQNHFASPSDPALFALAKDYIKGGQYLLTLGGEQVGGVQFSKRYSSYLYTNVSGFACLALSGVVNPATEQLKFSESRMVTAQ